MNMFDSAHMEVVNYSTRAGTVILAVTVMVPANPQVFPPTLASLKPVANSPATACCQDIGFLTVFTSILNGTHYK